MKNRNQDNRSGNRLADGKRQSSLRVAIAQGLVFCSLMLPALLPGQNLPSALLDIESTNQGFLLPRLTQAQRDSIVNPATGLMIFNTTTFCLDLNVGSAAGLPHWRSLDCRAAVSSLDCSGAVVTGLLYQGKPATGVSVSLAYTGGNEGGYPGQSISSTGVSGLTATLAGGSVNHGAGTLNFAITGTPSAVGTASFAINIGGQSCTLNLSVITCGAYVTPFAFKEFMCHNLAAANTLADPFQPSWEITGGYWQWGRKGPDPSAWLNTNTEHFRHGPTGPDAAQANDGPFSGWGYSNAPGSQWPLDEDPCPPGYTIPWEYDWYDIIANNPISYVGGWFSSSTNYSSGIFFGPGLMLPAAGYRDPFNEGMLFDRGYIGYYWCYTAPYDPNEEFAYNLSFYDNPGNYTEPQINDFFYRAYGFSVRCMKQ
jgi:hypothetical protein